jgi:hypothetical protein
MGLLNLFFKPARPLLQLHTGSFSLDRTGRVLAVTLPSSFPQALIEQIGQCVTATFREARDAQLPLEELVVHYPGLRITARDMRGGAIIFLTTPTTSDPNPKPVSL